MFKYYFLCSLAKLNKVLTGLLSHGVLFNLRYCLFALLFFNIDCSTSFANDDVINSQQVEHQLNLLKRYNIYIKPQNATSALNLLAEQTDAVLLFNYDQVKNKSINAIVGRYTLMEALALLLKDSGLKARLTAAGILNISAVPINEKKVKTKTEEKKEKTIVVEEESQENSVELITVTGIRHSLIKSINNKRFSNNIIDSISAEDIGKFPDNNIAESLQRITGVSIDRDGGEGKSVTIRGLGPSFNLALINGRTIASDTSNRSFSFDILPSEMIRGVDVYKSSNASLTEGGIGGTINIKTARPFDQLGFTSVVTAKALYNDSSGEISPGLSAMVSNTFYDDNIGVLFSINHHRSEETIRTVSNFQTVPGDLKVNRGPTWHPAGSETIYQNVYRPQSLDRRAEFEKRARTSGTLVFQYQPTDDLIITADALYSKFDVEAQGYAANTWFWNPTGNYDFEFDEDVRDIDGNITQHDPDKLAYFDSLSDSAKNWYNLDNHQPAGGVDPVFDNDGNVIFMQHGQTQLASSYNDRRRPSDLSLFGFNAQWQLTEQLSFNGDIFYSQANDDNKGYGRQLLVEGEGLGYVEYDYTDLGDYPKLNQTELANKDYPIENLWIAQIQKNGHDIEAENVGARFDFSYELDNDFITRVDFGLNLASNQKQNQEYRLDARVQNIYKFNGVPHLTVQSETVDAADFFVLGKIGLDLDGLDDDNIRFKDINDYMGYFSDPETLNRLLSVNIPNNGVAWVDTQEAQSGGWSSPVDMFNDLGGLTPLPTMNSYKIKEDITAIYLNSHYETELAGMTVNSMLGVRYVDTKLESTGTIDQLQDVIIAFAQIDDEGNTVPSSATQIFSATPVAVKHKNNYQNFLPNLNVNVHVTDDIIVRFAWSKTITRPELEDVAPGFSYGGVNTLNLVDLDNNGVLDAQEMVDSQGNSLVQGSANGSNPNLDPFESSNIDVSFEWYYSDDSAISIAYFQKDVDNWVTTGVEEDHYGFPSVPADIPYVVERPRNLEEAEIDGFEFSWLHTFDTGFGWQVNMTKIDSNAQLTIASDFSLEGLSDTCNAILFYQNDVFQVRLAYNWRDEFLQHTLWQWTKEPVFVASYQQFDLSASWQLNDTSSIFFEAINLTNEKNKKYGRSQAQFLQFSETGARYAAGLRIKF